MYAAIVLALLAPSVELHRADGGEYVVRVIDGGAGRLSVYVDSKDLALPPLLGSVKQQGADLMFVPQFPLQAGVSYRVVFESDQSLTKIVSVPVKTALAATQIEQIFPTGPLLPENQLKLYLHFSAPMSRGEAYRYIHLFDAAGAEVELPFLELGEELRDPEMRRFTLLFDPGRVKRDLVPNREVGPPLRAGQRYELVVDENWRDANGRALSRPFRKKFEVEVADRKAPDPKQWKIGAPTAGTKQPLTIEFPETMDQALLSRSLRISRERSFLVGATEISHFESRWSFTPLSQWQAGDYVLEIERALEDLAGNRIGRPFDVSAAEMKTLAPATGEPFRLSFRIERSQVSAP